MAILGLLFSNKRTVIGVKDDQKTINKFKGLFKEGVGGIGGIVVDATISEEHTSSCEVTDNPVEDGVKITDHVQMNPAQLSIEGVISDHPIGFALIGNVRNIARSVSEGLSSFGALSGNSSLNKGSLSIQAFNKMIDLQKTRQPFTVVTGLKRYQNMIMTELNVPRDVNKGNAIHFKATFKEVRIVKSESTAGNPSDGIKPLSSGTSDKGQRTSSPTKNSVAPPSPKSNGSALYNVFN